MNRGRAPSVSGYSTPRGRSSRPAAHSSHRGNHMAGAEGALPDDSLSRRGGSSHGGWRNTNPFSPSTFSGHSNHRPAQVYLPKKPLGDGTIRSTMLQLDQTDSNAYDCESRQLESFVAYNSAPGGCSALLSACSSSHGNVMKVQAGQVPTQGAVNEETLHHDHSLPSLNSGVKAQQPLQHCAKSTECSRENEHQALNETFDIFLPRTGVILKPSLLAKNREKRNVIKRALKLEGKILRPGMVLLKGYLSIDDQLKMVKLCRELGVGPGGFYQPSYHDGAKMHLRMMCLGRNWDHNTGSYGEYRPIDGAKPPKIPHVFCSLVEKAMKDTYALIETNSETSSVENTFPWMSPDICIVNFYSASGQLGLHQDKDESERSLRKGLPVVSFSIGDEGEFLYGDNRDEKNAMKVTLESGDVLIFGGKSRHIFHGVRSVRPNTAPKSLLQETNLRPGRLNLTFREY